MKHQNPNEMIPNAEAFMSHGVGAKLSRRERLARWANVLEAQGPLNALMRIEYLSPAERRAYRGVDTPLTVAFNDPVLREAGLGSDGLGDAMDFFGLSDREAHHLLCDCHYLGGMTGSGLAHRLRRHAGQEQSSLWSRIRNLFGGHATA
jgi:hypothetical protein